MIQVKVLHSQAALEFASVSPHAHYQPRIS